MAATAGIISDTHGLMRPEALAALAGAELIIHAGDVGSRKVLEALAAVAPVAAIRGNVDTERWAAGLPAARTVEFHGARIYVLDNLAELDFDPAARGYRAVISGHSHKAREETRDGVLYLNPGSAGPRRFRLPVTLARVAADAGELGVEFVTL